MTAACCTCDPAYRGGARPPEDPCGHGYTSEGCPVHDPEASQECCGACGQLYGPLGWHECELAPAPAGRRRWRAIVSFVADPDDAGELFAAIAAQAYEPDGDVTEVECEWLDEGEVTDGATAGQALGLALLSALRDVAQLAATCFRLTCSRGDPRWIEFDADEDGMIHSDLGVMRLRDFREHYSGTNHPDGTPRHGAVG